MATTRKTGTVKEKETTLSPEPMYNPFTNPTVELKRVFDYIVVGSGPAGSMVAKVLASDKTKQVLLLEAGPKLDKSKSTPPSEKKGKKGTKEKSETKAPEVKVSTTGFPEDEYLQIWDPAKLYQVMNDPRYFWPNMPQGTSTAIPGRTFEYKGAKLFGGNSSIDAMQFVVGSPDFWNNMNEQTKKTKNEEDTWAPAKVYKLLSELWKSQIVTRISPGPAVPLTGFELKLAKNAAQEFNVPLIPPYETYSTRLTTSTCCSFTNWDVYQSEKDEVRASATRVMFGAPMENLVIFTGVFVRRLLFEESSLSGMPGVEPLVRGVLVDLADKQEMIFLKSTVQNNVRTVVGSVFICAGIGSAPLLFRSGIGPKSQLQAARIPVRKDLSEVGKHIRNHTFVEIKMTWSLKASVETVEIQQAEDSTRAQSKDLYYGGAFLPLDKISKQLDKRYIQLIGVHDPFETVKVDKGIIQRHYSIMVSPLLPASEGTVSITDSKGSLSADLNLLGVESDLQQYMTIVPQLVQMITDQKKMFMTLAEPIPIQDKVKLKQWILANVKSMDHWMGSCRMGKDSTMGVVDRKGRVFGVQKLYIADASICPVPYDCGTSSFAYLVGAAIALMHRNDESKNSQTGKR